MILSAVTKQGRIYAILADYKAAKDFCDAYMDDAYIRNICGTCLTDMNAETFSHFCDTSCPERFLQLRYTSEVDK